MMSSKLDTSRVDVFALNARAVEICRNGDFRGAGELFKSALNQISSSLVEIAAAQGSAQVASSIRPVRLNSDSSQLEASRFLSRNQEQTSFAIYDRAFVTVDDTDRSLLSIVVLYNLGLMYHWIGLSTGRSQKKLLQKALQFYEMSLELVKGSINISGFGNLFLMALYNNMGHAHANFYNVEETQRCLEEVSHIMTSTSTEDQNGDLREEYVLLRLNLLFLHVLKTPAASAA